MVRINDVAAHPPSGRHGARPANSCLPVSSRPSPPAARRLVYSLSCSASLAAALLATPAVAQDLQTLRREMQDLKRQYDAQLQKMQRDYESRLQQMEERLKAAESNAATANSRAADAQKAAEAAQQAPAPAPAPALPAPPAQVAAPAGAGVSPGTAASASAFNPAIGVILDGRFGYFSQNPDTYRIPGVSLGDEARPGPRGFALGETEINFSANVDQ
jgi:TolA-binding protein